MKMKRWLSCTLALAMLLGLMGCGGTSDEAPMMVAAPLKMRL